MQKKKQEVEEAILNQAESEFYTYGFERASIRRIIKASGTTIGNFYNYFGSKEILFEVVVGNEYQKFTDFINQHEQETDSDRATEFFKQEGWRHLLPLMIGQILPDFNRKFVILLEGSKGTAFEHARNRLVTVLTEHLKEHCAEANMDMAYELQELLAEQIIDGIIRIVKQNEKDKQERNTQISNFLMFYILGVMSMLDWKI